MPYNKPKPHFGGPRPSNFRPSNSNSAPGQNGRRPFVRQKAEDELNINEEIKAPQVRLVGENIAVLVFVHIGKELSNCFLVEPVSVLGD